MNEFMRTKRRQRRHLALLLVLAVLVTAGVAGVFHLNAIAKTYQKVVLNCTAVPLEGPAYAGFFVHTHNEDCFDENGNLVCPLPEIKAHEHGADCYITTVVQTCTLPESDGHHHTEDCYTRVKGDLICEESTEPVYNEDGAIIAEGHVHTDECFAWTEELSCDMEEGEGAHHHDDSCFEYVTSLDCDKPEIILHTHTDDCYQKNEDGSIYVDEDGNSWLICGLQEVTEHIHGPECFTTIELDDGEPEGSDPESVTESAASGQFFSMDEENEDETGAEDADTPKETENGQNENPEAPKSVSYRQLGGEKGGATVLAEVPDSILNENARLFLSDYSEDLAKTAILSVVNANAAEGEEREISAIYVIDIGMTADGKTVIPEGETQIIFTLRTNEIRSMTAPKVYQLTNGTAVRVEDVTIDTEAGIAVFSAAGFSPYAVVDLTGEDAVDETAEGIDGVSMPAQTFSGETEDVVVSVTAPEGAFPEGTTMQVMMVEVDEETMSSVEDTLEGKVTGIQAVDITFYDEDGNKIEPQTAIQVNMKSAVVSESENVSLIHKPDADEAADPAAEAPALEVIEAAIVEQNDTVAPSDEITFESSAFSVYLIVGTESITVPFVAGDGSTYEVTVTYGADAEIPEGSALVVSELAKDSEDYQIYLEQTASAVGTDAEVLDYIKILDISILKDNEKVLLQAPVDVQIKLFDKEITEETAGEKTKVVHFGDDATTVIDPDQEGTTISFETTGFSYYAVTSYGATADLDGKSYAIVQVNTQAAQEQATGNNTVYEGRALTTSAQSNNTILAGATVSVETHESGLNIVTSGTTQIVEWTFEAVEGENTYYIKAPNGQYLNLSVNNALELSNTPQALTITAGTGNTAGKVRISNGDRRVQSSVSAGASRTANNNQYFYNGNSNDANYVYMTLCEIKEFDPNQYPTYSGEKTSVQDLVDGQRYIIYRNIYNEITGQYEDWVIDGNGNPVRAYDQGDSLSLHSEILPMWVLSILTDSSDQPNGYYIFRNEETGLILHPMADGTLVKAYDPATSPTTDGVALRGREGGEYTSTIEYWDGSAMKWYGYMFSTDGQVTLSPATGSDSQAFSFAKEPESSAGLHTVSTVDSAANGITIHMFNYPDRNTIANVTGSDGYGVGVIPKQHVGATLRDGYPVFTNGNSGSKLFEPTNTHHQGTGNHLFLESIYDSTGYYEYSAFNNFAHYNNNGTFTVYQETGTPSPTSQNFYFKRGNFFPYNELNTNNTAQNIYTGSGTLIDYENPSYGGTLYGFAGSADFYFGMTMDFHFLMPKDGYYKGSPLIYEFNGDDDLWIYIDDVLILDIGGVHDAFPGTINFVTGEITGGNGGAGGARTIKGCFKYAGVFPDGTPWDDGKVNEYFNGETFVSYGGHDFNMFYMEHGAGASNLEMRFNLPVIEKGKFTVEKKLEGTDQQKYSNVYFAYQAFQKDEDGHDIPLTNAVYEGTETSVNFYDSVEINGKTYTNVFYLKHGEAATFAELPEDVEYYVQELGVGTDYYDEIVVNDVKIDGIDATATDGIYPTTVATVANRARVTYSNHCSEKNLNGLRITKRLAEGSVDNGTTFEFRVLLENAEGALVPYSTGSYYIQNDEGDYFRYVNGQLTNNGKTPIAASVSGNNGTIAGIPADYTVVIKELLADTDFFVEEIRLPAGWELDGKTVESCAKSTMTGTSFSGNTITADGQIILDTDAEVIFTNKANQKLIARKVWESGDFVSQHGEIQVALYLRGENNVLTLVDGSVRTIAAPETAVEYTVPSLAAYVVREVTVNGETVTMKKENERIAVSGETTQIGSPETDVYVVAYSTEGEDQTPDTQDDTAAPQRTDVITNTMPKLIANKTDLNGNKLAGAAFQLLKEGSDGKKTVVTGYESIMSKSAEEAAEGGNLLNGIYLSQGTYYLQETHAPDGYNMLTKMVQIVVDERGITVSYDDGAPITDETADSLTIVTVSIPNNPGIELPQTGGEGTMIFSVLGAILILSSTLLILAKRKQEAYAPRH